MAIPTPNTNLSANDTRILSALFDPETLPSSYSAVKNASNIDASLPPLPDLSDSEISSLEAAETAAIRHLSTSSTPSRTDIDAAIRELEDIIRRSPAYASAYTNRAMARRLGCEMSTAALFAQSNTRALESVLEDLAKAVALAAPRVVKVSPFQARVLRTASSHRAYLYLKASQVVSSFGAEGEREVGLPDAMRGKSREELEEMASREFGVAARYGDRVAKEMSVRTNPYAKMCGAIVKNALREERREFAEGRRDV